MFCSSLFTWRVSSVEREGRVSRPQLWTSNWSYCTGQGWPHSRCKTLFLSLSWLYTVILRRVNQANPQSHSSSRWLQTLGSTCFTESWRGWSGSLISGTWMESFCTLHSTSPWPAFQHICLPHSQQDTCTSYALYKSQFVYSIINFLCTYIVYHLLPWGLRPCELLLVCSSHLWVGPWRRISPSRLGLSFRSFGHK